MAADTSAIGYIEKSQVDDTVKVKVILTVQQRSGVLTRTARRGGAQTGPTPKKAATLPAKTQPG